MSVVFEGLGLKVIGIQPKVTPASSLCTSDTPPCGQVVKLCRECLQKQEGVLADTHLHHLRILSTVSEVLSFMHSFKEAADCANRMVHGYE